MSNADDFLKVKRLEYITKLYEKTFDWGCNDKAKDLYTNAVYAIISEKPIFQECIDEFKDYILENS